MAGFKGNVIVTDANGGVRYADVLYACGPRFLEFGEWVRRQAPVKTWGNMLQKYSATEFTEFDKWVGEHVPRMTARRNGGEPLTDREFWLAQAVGITYPIQRRFWGNANDSVLRAKMNTLVNRCGWQYGPNGFDGGYISRAPSPREIRARLERRRSSDKVEKLRKLDAAVRAGGKSWSELTVFARSLGDLDSTYNSDALSKHWKWSSYALFVAKEYELSQMSDEEVRRRLMLESV